MLKRLVLPCNVVYCTPYKLSYYMYYNTCNCVCIVSAVSKKNPLQWKKTQGKCEIILSEMAGTTSPETGR